ncbi:MAG: OmpA family protein [Deltaproteobacteria bacterium]|nr:OmpA family protein [Deltaproteobacteria bacterium]
MPRIALAAVLVSLLAPGLVRAESIEFEVVPKVFAGGKEKPTLTLHTVEDANDVVVKLKREDGKTVQFRTGPIAGGTFKKFPLDVPAGREYRFSGSIERRYGKAIESLDVSFVAEVVVPAKISVDKDKVDLAAHKLVLTSSRRTSKVEVEVKGDQGEDLGQSSVAFDAAAPGTPLTVQWKQGEGNVMRISLRVWDTDNFYEGIELFPWHIYIPHEEVNFATGSFSIEKGEESKLDSSLGEVQEAVEKYGKFAEIKLFIAGHTDTVGPTDSNRSLSLNRARSISEWFRRHGLRVPILYEGFGEDALKVATADETEEVRNRRAEYIVAIEPPVVSQVRAASWKQLR